MKKRSKDVKHKLFQYTKINYEMSEMLTDAKNVILFQATKTVLKSERRVLNGYSSVLEISFLRMSILNSNTDYYTIYLNTKSSLRKVLKRNMLIYLSREKVLFVSSSSFGLLDNISIDLTKCISVLTKSEISNIKLNVL